MIRSVLSAKVGELFQHLDLLRGHVFEFALLVKFPYIVGIRTSQHTIKFTGALIVRPARAGENHPVPPFEETGEFGRRRTITIGVPHRRPDHSGGTSNASAMCLSSFCASHATAEGLILSTSSAWTALM